MKSQTDLLSVATSRNHKSVVMPRWMISQLKYKVIIVMFNTLMSFFIQKCSITLISLLEARKDYDLLPRMSKSIHKDILTRNITDTYNMFEKLYNGKYTKECFLHVIFIHLL